MGKETIELAKNYDPKKSIFPAYAQRKWDGVPVRFMCAAPGVVVAVTRQGEHVKSIPHIIAIVQKVLTVAGGCIIGELVTPGRDFKSVSGIVRRQTPDSETAGLICKVFDGDMQNLPKRSYHVRLHEIKEAITPLAAREIRVTPTRTVNSVQEIEFFHEQLTTFYAEDIEGVMFHDPTKPFQPGKRCWGMGRWKPQPVNTFKVVGFEEARSEAGAPLGMVGRVNILLQRRSLPAGSADGWGWSDGYWFNVVGVGPGKLSHADRRDIWIDPTSYMGHYADIKHMPDPSYEALRQPTFQCWRPDKTEGDILEY